MDTDILLDTDDAEVKPDDELDLPDLPRLPPAQVLADRLSHAEHVERIPELQKPWDEIVPDDDEHFWQPWLGATHPLVRDYMEARLAYQAAAAVTTPLPTNLDDAKELYRRGYADLRRAKRLREQIGLRRVVEAWAREFIAWRRYYALKSADDKRGRSDHPSRPVVDGYMKTRRTVLRDGVRVPVVESVQ
jgi:hypothetical protein